MQIISNIALISINETLIVQLISFLIFLFIMNRIMFRPLRSTMDKRNKHIEAIRLDIVDSGNELENMTNQLKEREAKVRKEAFSLKQEQEKAGKQRASEMFASTKQEIDKIKEKVEAEVDAKILEARKHIKKESETLAVNIMEKILDRGLAL